MNVIWGSSDPALNQALGDWCSVQIFGEPGELSAPYTTMGVVDERGLIATICYNNYQPEAGVIEVHGAGIDKRWLNRLTLHEMFAFPFDRLGCQSVVMRVDPDDRALSRMLTAYGFKKFLLPRLRGRDKDEAVFILHDDDWRANGFHTKGQAGGKEAA